MQGTEDEGRPYSYRRSFRNETVIGPAPDADKGALDAYIRNVLGIKEPNEKETTS